MLNPKTEIAQKLITRRIAELETTASNYDAVIGPSEIHKEAALRADFLKDLKTMAIIPTIGTNIDIIVGALSLYKTRLTSGMFEPEYRATLRSIQNAIDPKTAAEQKEIELKKIFEYCNAPSSFKHPHLQALLAATSDLILAAQAKSSTETPDYRSPAHYIRTEKTWDKHIKRRHDKTVFVRDTITSLLDAITPPEPKTEHAAGGEGGKGAGAAGGGGGVGVAKTEPAAETGSMAGAGGGGGGVGAAASQSTPLSTTPFQTQTGAGTTPIKERTSDL